MTAEKYEFKTEVKQLLDLMIHSLYSHKEVFLRELVSNASDAIDRARYESLTNSCISEDDSVWKIRIVPDKEKGTLTVSDNGIGMTREETIASLGTIAHSGTKDFLEILRSKEIRNNPELIGQFGVGFYSSFMVADRITVISRKAGAGVDAGIKWESTGDGTFDVEDRTKASKGTDVILHLKEEEKHFLDEWEIRNTIKKYSDFIEHPILLEVEREKQSEIDASQTIKVREEQVLNSMKAIWLRDKSDITGDEYNEFYKHLSHDHANPAKAIHYRAEGTSEFTALLYIPSKAPYNILYRDYKVGPTLYVKRVQIMDHCEELLPLYLRFVRGVVDSSDLPLNVSREILQNNRQVEIIRTNVTKKVLETLAEMKTEEPETYLGFYGEFGRILKEGIHYDFLRAEAISDLLLFPSTKSGDGRFRTLAEYVEDMKNEQQEIYYITGASLDETMKSPYLEAFKGQDYEVLIFLDEIDDLVLSGFSYKGKVLKSVIRGDVALDKEKAEVREKAKKEYGKLLELIKDQLKDQVKDARLSGRLTDSACCLVTDEGEMDAQMERWLKSMGQEIPKSKRILEINGDHPLFASMNGLFEKNPQDPVLREYIDLLYDQALLLEGSRPRDPASFARSVAGLMVAHVEKKS